MANVYIFSIIISKFYFKKKLYLIILFEVVRKLKIGFYYIILPFDLAIYLIIKRNIKFLLNTKKIIK